MKRYDLTDGELREDPDGDLVYFDELPPASTCSPYEIPVSDYTQMNLRTRIEWEVKAAYNRPNIPELPQDFLDYVVDRILELKDENTTDSNP